MEKSGKRRKYDAAFKAEALLVASESRYKQVADRALNIIRSCYTSGSKKHYPPYRLTRAAAWVERLSEASRRVSVQKAAS